MRQLSLKGVKMLKGTGKVCFGDASVYHFPLYTVRLESYGVSFAAISSFMLILEMLEHEC